MRTRFFSQYDEAKHETVHIVSVYGKVGREHSLRFLFNPLTPKPAETDHATSILVERISAGCCSERGEKAVGRMALKGFPGVKIRDKRPSIHIFQHP
ncbi:hypothetical protein AVEN_93747-1 [Araneus ventricosus]|uniref:Uncharacterized protein n=1 Tax=Araneus ventricosus TaxID=182803 RepID=A0A4Y2J860_ARAVE|nr:hypothetical protein AVEN_93747-1 [Araneus ventricosus]